MRKRGVLLRSLREFRRRARAMGYVFASSVHLRGVPVTRRDVSYVVGAALIGALVAVVVHEREMTMRALVVGLVRCAEARR